ncbi:MAG: HAD hydrolase-like protein [Candidatus Hodarchaeota archaeon]
MPIRAVIFGLGDTLIVEGKQDLEATVLDGLIGLFKYLREKNIRPIILSNREWFIKTETEKKPIDDYLKRRYGDLDLIIPSREGIPQKPNKACVKSVLEKFSLEPNEVIYVGNNDMDFRTAVNGGILFLNATWRIKSVEYGFCFDHPNEINQFIDNFCIKEHPWHFAITSPVEFYSLAPFSTYREEYENYSRAARAAAKADTPLKTFFLRHLISSIYQSGLYQGIDYITVYPGHEVGFGSDVMDNTLDIAGKLFRKRYIRDLIIRHRKAEKSQQARIEDKELDYALNQINTIHLNPSPHKDLSHTYSDFQKTIQGKIILVVDDFCTDGYSLETARNYIQAAGGRAMLLSWLKTINKPYLVINLNTDIDPFGPNELGAHDYTITPIEYTSQIVDPVASQELREKYTEYLRQYAD